MKSFEIDRISAKWDDRKHPAAKRKQAREFQDEGLQRYAMQLASMDFSTKLTSEVELRNSAWIITGFRPMFHVKRVAGHFEVVFYFHEQRCVLGVNRGPVEACRMADMFCIVLKLQDTHRMSRFNFSKERGLADLENEPLIAEPIRRSAYRVNWIFTKTDWKSQLGSCALPLR